MLTLLSITLLQKQVVLPRNMTGGVDEAVVGIITDAKYEDEEDDKYKVRFTGEVYREELFSALESGLWLRATTVFQSEAQVFLSLRRKMKRVA